MGMGDGKPPFRPSNKPVRDDVIGREFAACAVRSCPHPKVIQRFGVGGVANVSVYTCKRCKFHREYALHSGIGCEYGLDEGVRPGTES